MKPFGTVLTALVISAAPPVFGQGSDDSRVAAARSLVDEADDAWERGDWAVALERFERANAIVHVPTLTVREAECLVRMGKLVEASERYMAASRAKLGSDASEVVRQAVETAADEAEALRARLPSVVVDIRGGERKGAELRINGRTIPTVLWGAKVPVDPGGCHIELTRGAFRAQRDLSLSDKQQARVSLELPSQAGGAAAKSEAGDGRAAITSQGVIGWICFGVGAGGLAFGGVTGLMTGSKKSTLDGRCRSGVCPQDTADEVDAYNGLRTMSTVGFGIGVVGIGAGAALLLTAPSETNSARAGVAPWVGVGGAGMRGRF